MSNKSEPCEDCGMLNVNESLNLSKFQSPIGIMKSRRYNPYKNTAIPAIKSFKHEKTFSNNNEDQHQSIAINKEDCIVNNELDNLISDESADIFFSPMSCRIPCNQVNYLPGKENATLVANLSQYFQESENMTPIPENYNSCEDMFHENTSHFSPKMNDLSLNFSTDNKVKTSSNMSRYTSTPLKISNNNSKPDLFNKMSQIPDDVPKFILNKDKIDHKCEVPSANNIESESKNKNNMPFCHIGNQTYESSQYRREILEAFNACEMSICKENNDENSQSIIKELNKTNDSFMLNILINEISKPQKCLKTNLIKRRSAINQKQFTGSFYGLPPIAKSLILQYKRIEKLYDWQHECLTLPAIDKRDNLIYALPTSGGKTLVAEILMLREVTCRKKNVLFVLPFVSIVQEKIWGLSPFAVGLNFLIEEYAAGKGLFPPRKRRHKKSIYIATIEKALGLIRSLCELNRLGELGLIVIDELHLIGDSSRGCSLEMLLGNVMYSNEDIQIVGMSATIGNIDELAQFLNATVYTQDFRPVELKEYVKYGDDIMAINWRAKEDGERISFDRKVNYGYSPSIEKIDPDHLGGLVMEVIPKGSCLIFCPTKKRCENVASLLCRVIFKNLLEYRSQEKKALMEALKSEGSNENSLISLLPWGIAYHHSGLAVDERRLIEDAFRSGVISVICCTSTLAAGVNLPAQRVILRSVFVGNKFMSKSTYKQMVGRAGRAGFGGHGDSILICPPNLVDKVTQLIVAPIEDACSNMHSNGGVNMRTFIIGAIALGTATTPKKLKSLVENTLLKVQAERMEVNIKDLMYKTIEMLVKMKVVQIKHQPSNDLNSLSIVMNQTDKSMLNCTSKASTSAATNNLCTLKNVNCITISNHTELIVSALGKAAVKGCIELKRATQLYADLRKAQNGLVVIGVLHLLYLVTPYDLVETVKPNLHTYYNICTHMGEEALQTANVIGITNYVIVQMVKGKIAKSISESILNRFYIALMLHDLWNQESLPCVSEKFLVNRGMVQTLMSSAATFASCVLRFCEELPEFWAFKDLLTPFTQRLAHCCVLELVPLMTLPNVRKGRAMQLYKAGYKSIKSIAQANPTDLMESLENINRNVVNQLISAAKLQLLERVENLREEAEEVMEELGVK